MGRVRHLPVKRFVARSGGKAEVDESQKVHPDEHEEGSENLVEVPLKKLGEPRYREQSENRNGANGGIRQGAADRVRQCRSQGARWVANLPCEE